MTVNDLRARAVIQSRPMVVWKTTSGYGWVWLDIERIKSGKVRTGLKDRVIKGLTRTAKLRDTLLWYAVTDGHHIIEEYEGRFYCG